MDVMDVASTARTLEVLELTHVLYDGDSVLSLALALVTLSPILLMACYAALAIVTRELLIINMWAGQLACETLNWVIKHAVRQARPVASLGSGYGFPSSHSQYMGYFATFLIMHMYFRHGFESFVDAYEDAVVSSASRFVSNTGSNLDSDNRLKQVNPAKSAIQIDFVEMQQVRTWLPPKWALATLDALSRSIVYVILVIWAGAVCYSRYRLSYHTPSQVFAGLAIGVLCGMGTYTVCELLPFWGLLITVGKRVEQMQRDGADQVENAGSAARAKFEDGGLLEDVDVSEAERMATSSVLSLDSGYRTRSANELRRRKLTPLSRFTPVASPNNLFNYPVYPAYPDHHRSASHVLVRAVCLSSSIPQSLVPLAVRAHTLRISLLRHPLVRWWLRIRDGWAVWADGGRAIEWCRWVDVWEGLVGDVDKSGGQDERRKEKCNS